MDHLYRHRAIRPWARTVLLAACCMPAALWSGSAMAVVVISDGFGDADRNNNGTPLESADVDAGGFAGGGAIGTYAPARASNPDPNPDPEIDDRARNDELTAVLDSGDVGIRWFS